MVDTRSKNNSANQQNANTQGVGSKPAPVHQGNTEKSTTDSKSDKQNPKKNSSKEKK